MSQGSRSDVIAWKTVDWNLSDAQDTRSIQFVSWDLVFHFWNIGCHLLNILFTNFLFGVHLFFIPRPGFCYELGWVKNYFSFSHPISFFINQNYNCSLLYIWIYSQRLAAIYLTISRCHLHKIPRDLIYKRFRRTLGFNFQ